jgi:hypothetical protein
MAYLPAAHFMRWNLVLDLAAIAGVQLDAEQLAINWVRRD